MSALPLQVPPFHLCGHPEFGPHHCMSQARVTRSSPGPHSEPSSLCLYPQALTRTFHVSCSGGWKSKFKVLAGLAPSEDYKERVCSRLLSRLLVLPWLVALEPVFTWPSPCDVSVFKSPLFFFYIYLFILRESIGGEAEREEERILNRLHGAPCAARSHDCEIMT